MSSYTEQLSEPKLLPSSSAPHGESFGARSLPAGGESDPGRLVFNTKEKISDGLQILLRRLVEERVQFLRSGPLLSRGEKTDGIMEENDAGSRVAQKTKVLIDVDSVYSGIPSISTPGQNGRVPLEGDPFLAVAPVLDRFLEWGWDIAFWSTRPKRQTYSIIESLKRAGIWDKASLVSGGDQLLYTLDNPDGTLRSLQATKLTILESAFSQDLDSQELNLIAIEADPVEASILGCYSKRVRILLAPQAWIKILALSGEERELLEWRQ